MRVLIALAACTPLVLGCEMLDEMMGASRESRCGHVDWQRLGLRDAVMGVEDGAERLQHICGDLFQPVLYREGLEEGLARRPRSPV